MITLGSTIEEREGGTEDGALTPDGSTYPEQLGTRRFDAGGAGRWLYGRNILSVRGSASSQHHRHRFGALRERDSHLTWFGEASNTYTRGSTVWVLGTALQQERYVNDDVAGFDFAFTTPSLFGQSTMDVGRRFSLTASARVDRHSEYGAQFAPRISALIRLGSIWTVRASGGGGYFAPTPFTEETEVTGLRPMQRLAGLRAEKATGASVDLGGSLGPVEVNATVFRSTISNPVAVRHLEFDESRIKLENVDGDTRTAGGELLARWNPEPFHITATYTYVRSSEEDPDTGSRRQVPLTPSQQAGIVAAWEEEGRARVGVEFYYTGRQALDDNPYRTVSKPYLHIGTMAERRVGSVRVFLNAENLLGFMQTRHDRLVLPGRGVGGRWTTDVWGPLEGRVANIGLRIDSR
ncbi:MAG: TonB-dependent receptor plug domain-containing protein [Gemmatimonadaceae bacterium]